MNAFTDLVGSEWPIQQAGMSGTATAALAAAVSNAGGLGMIGVGGQQLAVVERYLDEVATLTGAPVGATCIAQFVPPDVVELLASRLPIVEFFYEWPDAARVPTDVICGWQVGSVDEAKAAVDAGCRYVIAQGNEAGGHVRGHLPLAELLPAVRAGVSVPVVAAGGIGNVAAIRSAVALGADAVRVGTRFVATRESYAHPEYIDALVAAKTEDSVLTEAFGIGWPDAPHRVLRSAIDAAESAPDDLVGQTQPAGEEAMPMPRFGVSTPTRDTTGNISAMALYAGRSVGSVDRVMSAAEVVEELSAAFT
ncbi:MAG: nitronate monooxygenase [Ilumatobacteraceae bacterium]|jgi:NAD(P)H-dependent flavin oxidoreductase YrpB (nitropropane dioxygenase family)